jgi:hypothetical protein
MNLPPELTYASQKQIDHYISMMEDGQSESFSLMCSLGQPPGTQGSDRAFMERRCNSEWLDDMPPHQARRILREAKAAGIDTAGKFYMSGLADKRGHADPEAWISDRSDVERVARKRNLTVEGSVNVKGTVEGPPESKAISKKAEDRLVKLHMQKDKSLSKSAAKARVHEQHIPKWKKK